MRSRKAVVVAASIGMVAGLVGALWSMAGIGAAAGLGWRFPVDVHPDVAPVFFLVMMVAGALVSVRAFVFFSGELANIRFERRAWRAEQARVPAARARRRRGR